LVRRCSEVKTERHKRVVGRNTQEHTFHFLEAGEDWVDFDMDQPNRWWGHDTSFDKDCKACDPLLATARSRSQQRRLAIQRGEV
jgi:hypothetical protein